MTTVDRRSFLRKSAGFAGGALVAPSIAGLAACSEAPAMTAGSPRLRVAGLGAGGYGALTPHRKLPFLVPQGFQLLELSRAGDPMHGNGSVRVPNAFDGMGCFAMPNGRLRLVRNHEIRDVPAESVPMGRKPYDALAGGGTTTIELNIDGAGKPHVLREWTSLSGTTVNCAGGVTPSGSWLTCEETVEGIAQGRAQNHGYVFEVPAGADDEVDAIPLNAMGRFAHEAIAVDPLSGFIYETEDAGSNSGFYRFIPNNANDLPRGGRLQMLGVAGSPKFDTRNQTAGQPNAMSPLVPFPATWVDVPNPDPATITGTSSCFAQGFGAGGARFARLEGCWYGDRSIFFNATSGGRQGAGQVFQYQLDTRQLLLVFESPSPDVLDAPDNICVSPRGGLVLCEDGGGAQFMRGLTRDGRIFDLVRSADPNEATEFAGACFSPDGDILFFNTQGSTSRLGEERGGTFALLGPWEMGAL